MLLPAFRCPAFDFSHRQTAVYLIDGCAVKVAIYYSSEIIFPVCELTQFSSHKPKLDWSKSGQLPNENL